MCHPRALEAAQCVTLEQEGLTVHCEEFKVNALKKANELKL